jgi:hypothetical protein
MSERGTDTCSYSSDSLTPEKDSELLDEESLITRTLRVEETGDVGYLATL